MRWATTLYFLRGGAARRASPGLACYHLGMSLAEDSDSRFATFILDGNRFKAPGIPVEALAELVTYRALVVDVAKRCYLMDHPDRSRSRRNMEGAFNLRLQEILDGSADLLIRRQPANDDGSSEAMVEVQDYFDRARDLVTETISSVSNGGRVPSSFPLRSLPKFRHLGRTLTSEDQIKMGAADHHGFVYVTRSVRSTFLDIIRQMSQPSDYEEAGQVVEIDTERGVFHLRTLDGNRVQCSFDTAKVSVPSHLLVEANGEGPVVSVEGVARISEDGDLESFENVIKISHLPTLPITEEIYSFTKLNERWLGEPSLPLDKGIAQRAIDVLESSRNLPSDLAVAPLPEGGLRFEWAHGDTDFVLEIEPGGQVYACSLAEDAEKDVDAEFSQDDVDRLRRILEVGRID